MFVVLWFFNANFALDNFTFNLYHSSQLGYFFFLWRWKLVMGKLIFHVKRKRNSYFQRRWSDRIKGCRKAMRRISHKSFPCRNYWETETERIDTRKEQNPHTMKDNSSIKAQEYLSTHCHILHSKPELQQLNQWDTVG